MIGIENHGERKRKSWCVDSVNELGVYAGLCES